MFGRRLLIVLVLSSFGLISCSMQKLVEKEGWIPLRTFDFVQIGQSQPEKPASSAAHDAQKPLTQATDEKKDSDPKEFTFLGAIVPFDHLDEYGLLWNKTHVISNMANPSPIPYKYKVLYARGPVTILKEQNYKIKLTDVNIDSRLKFGIAGGLKSNFEFNNIIRAYIDIKDEDFVKVLENSDTMEKSERNFWITEILAADITNTEAAGLIFDAKVPLENFKVDIEVGIGDANKETITLHGPGLMFGARGYVITASDIGTLADFDIPNQGAQPLTVPLPVGNNKKLLVVRTEANSVDFSIIGASAGRVYFKNDKGEWQQDNKTQAVASIKLPVGEATETALAKAKPSEDDIRRAGAYVEKAFVPSIKLPAGETIETAPVVAEPFEDYVDRRGALELGVVQERALALTSTVDDRLAAIMLPSVTWTQQVKIVERLPRRSNVIVITIVKSETNFKTYVHMYSVQMEAASTVEKYLEVLRREK